MMEYIGIPFAERGRDRSGCDCWGLVRLVYRERHGIELPSFVADYRSTKDDGIGNLITTESARWLPVSEPQAGDLAVFRGMGRWHIAYCLSASQVLHAQRGTDSMISDLPLSGYRLDGYYRWA